MVSIGLHKSPEGTLAAFRSAPTHMFANYRAVVLFSLWYRLYGCLRTRCLLEQLEANADFPAFGFLVGRGCCDLTFAVQSAVEASLRGDHGLCGVMCDIEKCFSGIPRKPIYVLARLFQGCDCLVLFSPYYEAIFHCMW